MGNKDFVKVQTRLTTKTIIVEILDATIGMLLITAILVMAGGIMYILK